MTSLNNKFHKTKKIIGNHDQRNSVKHNGHTHCRFYARMVNRNLKQMYVLLKKKPFNTYIYCKEPM